MIMFKCVSKSIKLEKNALITKKTQNRYAFMCEIKFQN